MKVNILVENETFNAKCLNFLFSSDLTSNQLSRKAELCTQMIEALSSFEPGISNSAANVKLELSLAKIAQIKRQKNLEKREAEKLVADEVRSARDALDTLMAQSEGKMLLENRLSRIISLSLT